MHNPRDLLRVTPEELHFLQAFQQRVASDADFSRSVFGGGRLPDTDDPSWWTHMSHYDLDYGTRMIDITTSLFCALYFACADWNGRVDTTVDGALYLLPGVPGREETATPHIVKGVNVGPDDLAMPSARAYFNVSDHEEVPRFREARDRNDRLVAQDGFFIWQPKFDKPIERPQHFKFRIYREAKPRILCELYSIGYTARRIVRGPTGEEAHRLLCDFLGLRP